MYTRIVWKMNQRHIVTRVLIPSILLILQNCMSLLLFTFMGMLCVFHGVVHVYGTVFHVPVAVVHLHGTVVRVDGYSAVVRVNGAVVCQVDDTIEGVKAVPRNAQAAAKAKADELAAGVKSIPDIIVEAAKVSTTVRDIT